MGQGFVVSGVALLATSLLVVPNSLFDQGVPNTISRYGARQSHLIAVLWQNVCSPTTA